MSIDTGATRTPNSRTLPAAGTEPGRTLPDADPGETLPEGLVIDGRYHVESELGRGGMGVVYLARDVALDRLVALKMIAPGLEGDVSMSARFLREARALAAIQSPHVVQIHAFGAHEGVVFFAMEYVRGRTLRDILAEHRLHDDPVPLHRALTLLSRIARAVGAVHAAGLVHRDVKPANVVIEEDTGRPVLVDFGLALRDADVATTLKLGTPHYMAPEQAGFCAPGATVGPGTDVYALGVMAFELLSGRLPFDGNCAALLQQHALVTPPLLSSIRPELWPFDEVVARALAKAPDERHASCAAFGEALAAAGRRIVSSKVPTAPMAPIVVQATAPPATAAQPSRPFCVLVVDDSPLFRRFAVCAAQVAIQRRHPRRGVVVEGVGSGEEALDRAAAQPPDLVILDLDMPGLDGVETLSHLRALPGGDAARVVVLSGRVRPSDRWRFAVLGVSDFLSKPIPFAALADRIEAIARRHDDSAPLPAV